jgi:hypothetical protein
MSERHSSSRSFADDVRRYLLAKPFVPFEIVVEGNERFQITDSFQVAIGENSLFAIMPGMGLTRIRRDRIVAVDVLEHSA